MVIATVDIGGTGIKFAAMSKEGEILEKQELATPDNLGDLLAWLDSCLSKRAYQGQLIEKQASLAVLARCLISMVFHGMISWLLTVYRFT